MLAGSFEFKAGGNYCYDEALRKVDMDDACVRFTVKEWQEE